MRCKRVYWRDVSGKLRWADRRKASLYVRAMFAATKEVLSGAPLRYRVIAK